MKKSNTLIGQIQESTGLTLRRIAQFLHIDSGWLSKYVRNERMLPAKTTLTLLDLFRLIQETNPAMLPPPDAKQQEKWRLEATMKQFEAKAMEQEWLQMQTAVDAALRLKQLAEDLPKKMHLTPLQIQWAGIQVYLADKVIAAKGPAAQQNLYMKWQLCLKEVELLEMAVKGE